ncbi:hypothetical protein BJ138DRAFT_1179599 [Hygrophoropsis aurantiaca]|uniref:Uncharacterized protein n=1 Tax=Hygrophoropsis aurantiaca TaxID=72124 RepID=A0ACB8AE27_9AGAM|nr:hypothetical protein BJ138DRAFT_1179599 [Hygrophoropsis aurantiaca]
MRIYIEPNPKSHTFTSMAEINNQLPPKVVEFCAMFPPSARLCRFINRRSGTLLDVRPNLHVANDDVPRVMGETSFGHYISSSVWLNVDSKWLITPYGRGQAIIPVPKDGSHEVRYLTPSTTHFAPATVSPFPTSWILLPSADCLKDGPRVAYSVPRGLYEEWTCLISWPHFTRHEARMLDLRGGEPSPNQPVVICPFEHGAQSQYWCVQFIRYKPMTSIPAILPNPTVTVQGPPEPGGACPCSSPPHGGVSAPHHDGPRVYRHKTISNPGQSVSIFSIDHRKFGWNQKDWKD